MWLPGTKGTTNGGGVGGVNFFAEKWANFFGGQNFAENSACRDRRGARELCGCQRGKRLASCGAARSKK
jgi:hypothetical protein